MREMLLLILAAMLRRFEGVSTFWDRPSRLRRWPTFLSGARKGHASDGKQVE